METRHTLGTKGATEPDIELKRDAFGTIEFDAGRRCVIRNTAEAVPCARWLARRLARREARALRQLTGTVAFPQLLEATPGGLVRSYLPGAPLYAASFDARSYFRDALRQLRRMHALGIAHNDLAKEANWICMPGNRAGIVDFQIACRFRQRGRIFRTLAREDLRHLLKHKQHYSAELLTRRQSAILAQPLWTSRLWRSCFKPVYRFVTRRLLGWPERNSAIERTI